jgi:Ca2+-transporting ATPase
MPFSPIQIILLELFMDLAASAGFVREPEEKDIYLRPPRAPKEAIMNAPSTLDVFLKGIVLFVTVMAVYFYARTNSLSVQMTQTYAFSAWIFAHIWMAFVSRSDKQTLYRSGIFSNIIIDLWSLLAIGFLISAVYVPYLSAQFRLTVISPLILIYIAMFSLILVGSLELRKLVQKT